MSALPPAVPDHLGRDVARVLMEGDLSKLTPDQKVNYYLKVCDSLGLNPYTKPFDYLRLSGREILYARKDATDQLRKLRHVSIVRLDRERLDDLYVVTATARMPDGRTDSAIGAVLVQGLRGEALANALMKAETKAKRRVTLSICGLGWTDESEIDTIPGAQRVDIRVDDEGQVLGLPVAPPMDTEEVQPEPDWLPMRERDIEDHAARPSSAGAAPGGPQLGTHQGRGGAVAPPVPPRRPTHPESADVRAEALQRNAALLQDAEALGVRGLRALRALGTDAVGDIDAKNAELGERVRSHRADPSDEAPDARQVAF